MPGFFFFKELRLIDSAWTNTRKKSEVRNGDCIAHQGKKEKSKATMPKKMIMGAGYWLKGGEKEQQVKNTRHKGRRDRTCHNLKIKKTTT